VEGIGIARRLARTPAFASVIGAEIQPGSAVQSSAELRAYIRSHASTVFHPVGTCKMGSDPLAVVDAQLRVHGVTAMADVVKVADMLRRDAGLDCDGSGETR